MTKQKLITVNDYRPGPGIWVKPEKEIGLTKLNVHFELDKEAGQRFVMSEADRHARLAIAQKEQRGWKHIHPKSGLPVFESPLSEEDIKPLHKATDLFLPGGETAAAQDRVNPTRQRRGYCVQLWFIAPLINVPVREKPTEVEGFASELKVYKQ